MWVKKMVAVTLILFTLFILYTIYAGIFAL